MDIITETATVYTVKLSDADVGEILADPSDFQRQLRELRQGESKQRAKRMGRKVVDYPKVQAAHQRAAADPGRSTASRTPCNLCGKPLTPKGVTRHMRQSHPDAAAAEIA